MGLGLCGGGELQYYLCVGIFGHFWGPGSHGTITNADFTKAVVPYWASVLKGIELPIYVIDLCNLYMCLL